MCTNAENWQNTRFARNERSFEKLRKVKKKLMSHKSTEI